MNLETNFPNLSYEDVKKYIDQHQQEHLQLEFKTINNSSMNSSDDKRNLAKALSGFANSTGGVLIWGVETDKRQDGIDAANGAKEIEPLDLFISRLNQLTGEAVNPMVEGVLHRALNNPDQNNIGFAVTLVPASDSGPHMAKLGENRYYKRSGDSFYQMEHFDIEDMFGRRKKPKLELFTEIIGKGRNTMIVIGITNIGRGTAKGPYIAFSKPKPFELSNFGLSHGGNGLPIIYTKNRILPYHFGGSSVYVIHPGTTLQVAALHINLPNTKPISIPDTIIILYEITAEDCMIVKSEFTVDLRQTS